MNRPSARRGLAGIEFTVRAPPIPSISALLLQFPETVHCAAKDVPKPSFPLLNYYINMDAMNHLEQLMQNFTNKFLSPNYSRVIIS